ncbi:MAG: putative toxin-antitoxin system toxin component, PIN family [Acetobacteraceae bacterium]
MCQAVDAEIAEMVNRPRFASGVSEMRRSRILDALRRRAAWFTPTEVVNDCRDAKDNKYLELALSTGAATIVGGDNDPLRLHPWRGVHILRPAEFLAGK